MEKYYNQERDLGRIISIKENGYGFIKGLDEENVFFHANEVLGVEFQDLRIGNLVEYRIETKRSRRRATEVIVVSNEGVHAK